MDVNDVLHRVVRGHWRLLCACLVLPVLAVGGAFLASSPGWVATVRLQGGTTLPGSDTEADALLNLVKGVATSRAVMVRALEEAGIPVQEAPAMAADVDVTRLGSSTVFDLSVTAPQPEEAVDVTRSLATSVVTYINNSGDTRTANLLDGLSNRQKELLDQRQKTASALALSKDPVETANLSAQLSGIDQQLADIRSTMQQLELTGTSAASSGSATIISAASPAVRAGNHLSADLGLALVVGLVAGLLLASVAETLRPRLAGARSLGRELGVGLIGTLPAAARHRSRRAGASDPSQLPAPAPEVTLPPEVVLALTTAAARAGVDEVLLVGPAGHPSAQATAAHLRDALSRRPPAGPPARAGGPVEGPVNGTPLPRLPFEHPAPGHDGPREPVPTATLVAGPVRARRAGTGPVSGRALGVHAIDDHAPVGTGRPGLLAVVPPRAPHALADRVRDLAATTGWPVIGVLGVAAPSRRDRRAGLPGEE